MTNQNYNSILGVLSARCGEFPVIYEHAFEFRYKRATNALQTKHRSFKTVQQNVLQYQ